MHRDGGGHGDGGHTIDGVNGYIVDEGHGCLAAVARNSTELAPEIARSIRQRLLTAIDPAAGVELASADVPEFRKLAEDLAADDSI